MSETKQPSLAAKLARIGKEIGAVDKSGRNSQQNYNYIEYGVVAGRIRELFDTYKVIIVPSVENCQTDEITNKYGGRGYHYTITMSFKLINGDDINDTLSATWMGESADYGDKGINKAETSGTKYFLMRLFNVSEKGEEEADAKTPEIGATKRISNANDMDIMPDSEFDADEILDAQDKLRTAKDLRELQEIFTHGLGKIRSCPEVMATKDELKRKFADQQSKAVFDNVRAVLAGKSNE